MRRLKVLYLVPQPRRPGELARYPFLSEEIQALEKEGVEPHVLYRRMLPPRAWRRLALETIPFVIGVASTIPARNLICRRCFSAFEVEQFAATLIREQKIDLIHSHFGWPSGSGGALASAATGVPLVASLRGHDLVQDESIGYGARKDAAYDRAIRRLLRSADRTIYFSEWMRRHGERLGARPDRCRVIRKGVNLSQFQVADDREFEKSQLGLPSGPMVLSTAGLIPLKRIGDILQALGILSKDHDFHYVVCGDGPLLEELRALAQRLGIGQRTTFAGRVPRDTIARYFRACDVFVHAPRFEAVGNVLLEAMASGRPVVCTDAGGPAEYVQHERTGFVVPVGDTVALAARVRTLLEDPGRADALGAAGRREAELHADYRSMTSAILDVYDEVRR